MNNKEIVAERKQYSIVIIGSFNPEMFHPQWFNRQGIISQEDMEFAIDQNSQSPLVVAPQLTIFRTPQMTVQIDTKRFEVKADKEPLISLIDFVTKTFENLSSYSIKAFGFNFIANYKAESKEEYHKIGDLLAPKGYWEELLNEEITGNDRISGLDFIRMKKQKKDSNNYILFTLQSSPFFLNAFMLSCNDHNVLDENNQSADRAMDLINERYKEAFDNMQNMQIKLMERVRG